MASVRSLAKDTAIYGMSSIIGRFLNWLLVPLYTRLFLPDEYGVVTYVYAAVALALVVLTYGMETGFFRFANHERWSDPQQVYSTSMISLATTSTAFCVLFFLLRQPLSELLQCGAHTSWAVMMAVTVALDAFTALPFCYLRYRKRPVRFAIIKLLGIALNIGFNLFFLIACPWLMKIAPGAVSWCYVADFGIGYIFLSNLLSSAITLIVLLPELTGFRWNFNSKLWREMISYSAPLLVLGIVGVMNQTVGTLIFPYLYPGDAEAAHAQLGIYSANYKIAIVLVMFIQAFRFAYEPFIFAQSKEKGEDSRQSYADAMKFFVILTLFIFLAVMYYLDFVKILIQARYWEGLKIVPILMIGEFFFGIHFNLSLWYKLSDRTSWGAWFSLIGLTVTIAANVAMVPTMGYLGCAWAAFLCYGVMMVVSYFLGQHYYPIPYPVKRIAGYIAAAAVAYVIGIYVVCSGIPAVDYAVRALLLVAYLAFVCRRERISPSDLIRPILSKIRR